MTDRTEYLFGDWQDRSIAVEPSPEFAAVARWLGGTDEPMTLALAAGVRAEFTAQERYRQEMRAAIAETASRLFAMAHERSRGTDNVPRTNLEHFRHGYDHGAYRGYCEAGELVAAAISRANVAAQRE